MLGIPYFEEGLALASTLKEIVVLVWGIVYILHDHIVGGDAIARNEEEGLIVDFIEVADLASGDKGQGALQICGSQSLSHCEIVQLVSWRKVVMRHLFFPECCPALQPCSLRCRSIIPNTRALGTIPLIEHSKMWQP